MSVQRVALYLRVSTDGQTTDNQRRELETVVQQRGWQVVEVYEDAGISGSKGREQRPAFDRLMSDATRGKFSVVMAWSVDRLGRSLKHLVTCIEELRAVRCDLFLHQQALDTTTPHGRAMFQMCGVFAEFERSIIQQRVRAGLARAKSEGKKLGRPRIPTDIELQILDELRSGEIGIRHIARKNNVGVSVVQRLQRQLRDF